MMRPLLSPLSKDIRAQRNVTQVRNTNWFQNSVLISWQELRSWRRMPKKCPKDWTNIASVKSIPCDCSSNDCFPSQPLLQKIKDETFWLKPQILWEMLSIWLHFYQRRRLSSAAYLEKTRNIYLKMSSEIWYFLLNLQQLNPIHWTLTAPVKTLHDGSFFQIDERFYLIGNLFKL